MKSLSALLLAAVFSLSTHGLRASDVTVHGHVNEFAAPAPIAGAEVSIQFLSVFGYVQIGSTTTASDGSYAWTGNCPTSFTSLCRVRASAVNHVFAQQFFDALGMPDADLEFSLHRAAKIAGTVRAAGSQPLEQASIRVDCVPLDPACIYNTFASTAADGSYSVDGIPGGTYRVCFTPGSDNDPLIAQCHDHIDVGAFAQDPLYSPLTLADAETRNGIDFDLHTGGTIAGSVSDGYLHQSIANQYLNIQVSDANGALLFQRGLRSDADGRYEIHGLADGSYYLSINAGSPFEGTIVYPDVHCTKGCEPTWGQAITISGAGTVPDIDFEFDPAAVVTGRVTNTQNGTGLTGIPVAYSECIPLLGCPGHEPVATDASGNFVLFVPAGVPISIFTSNLRPWIDQAYPGIPCMGVVCEGAAPPLTLAAGEHRDNVDFQLVLGTSIAGRIVDAHPTDVLIAVLFDAQLHDFFTVYADEAGHYETPAWFAGTYYIQGESDNACVWYDALDCNYGDYDPPILPTPIVLQAGETRTGIDFQLDSGERIFRDGF